MPTRYPAMIGNVRTEAMNLPVTKGGGPPALNGKALISTAIVATVAMIVVVRASAMSSATTEPQQPAQLASTGSAECEKNVWPYVTSGCLQGAASSENVRVVVGQPPPDAQTQAREAEARYNKAMHAQPRKREHYDDVTRERRTRRNATFF